MKSRKKTRNDKKEETTLNRQLLKYSLAAGTTLAMAQPADAAIICNSPPAGEGVVNSGASYCVDLDGDNYYDFCINYISGTENSIRWRGIALYPYYSSHAFVGGSYTAYPWVKKLSQGYLVGPNNDWYPGSTFRYGTLNGGYYYLDNGPYNPFGSFFGDSGCFGVRFHSEIDDAFHYGWIEYEGDNGPSGRVIGWGYETEPGTPIPACECEEIPVPTLNPLGLLILAGLILAGGGVAIARRNRKK